VRLATVKSSRYWTSDEDALFGSDLSDDEITMLVGRFGIGGHAAPLESYVGSRTGQLLHRTSGQSSRRPLEVRQGWRSGRVLAMAGGIPTSRLRDLFGS